VALVEAARIKQPRLGTRKLCYLLEQQLSSYKVGRDKLFSILRVNNLLIKPRKQYRKTTDSKHWLKKHKNLTQHIELVKPEQLWVADITYISTREGHSYLSLVTDAYSKQIMGYHLSESLSATGCLKALAMAIKERKYDHELIHHSDRGLQYCCDAYQQMLLQAGIKPSMTEQYDPYENAVAERVNGILKDEFDLERGFVRHLEAVKVIKESVEIYNQFRPHLSCGFLTPQQMHQQQSVKLIKYKKKTSKTNVLEVNLN
jgi:transposase InsO family protein